MSSIDEVIRIANSRLFPRRSPAEEKYIQDYGRVNRAIIGAIRRNSDDSAKQHGGYGTNSNDLHVEGIISVKPQSRLERLTALFHPQFSTVEMEGQPDMTVYRDILQHINPDIAIQEGKKGSATMFLIHEESNGLSYEQNLAKILPTNDGNHIVRVYDKTNSAEKHVVNQDIPKILVCYSMVKQ